MKNPIKLISHKAFSVLCILSIFISCSTPNSEDTKVRRFTFSMPITSFKSLDFNKNDHDLILNGFKFRDKFFLIIDAPEDYNFNRVAEEIKKHNPYLHKAMESTFPLERIYKLDQKNEYGATEGQVITSNASLKKYVLTLEIVNDPQLRKEYKRVHAKGMAWPEITANMKQVGVKDMEIYLDGYQAYLIMDTKPDFDFEKDGEQWSKLPRESEWQEYVAKFQKVDPESKATEKWQEMKRVTEETSQRFQESWESLGNYKIPQWMKEAKFGIFIHWGPNAVAELHTDWYARWMYLDEGNLDTQTGELTNNTPHPAVAHHRSKFGDQKDFGYKDLIPMFTMENFNANAWVTLFKKAGAQYVIPVAEHHDGFALYESSITPYNAVAMGPKRDVYKELIDEVKKQGLIAGASSHLAFNWNFYNQQERFDTGDAQYAALYAPPHKNGLPASEAWLNDVWWPRTKEIIDKYDPDILWFDFYVDRQEFTPYHKKLAAYYYNSGLDRGKSVVLQTKNFKNESFPIGTHMLDLERSKLDSVRSEYWQTDTSIGKNSWYYSANWIPKSAGDLIADLVDIVSKNGCLLLNIGPKKDGTIPEDQQKTLLDMGKWLEINGEAIYACDYWEVYGEGPTKINLGHLSEDKNKRFTQADIRFTKKGNILYAIVLVEPTKDINIKYLSDNKISIKSMQLLGYDHPLTFEQDANGTTVKLPTDASLEHAWVFKITTE